MVKKLSSGLALAAADHLRAAGHLDLASDLLARHADVSDELLMARASLRVAKVRLVTLQ